MRGSAGIQCAPPPADCPGVSGSTLVWLNTEQMFRITAAIMDNSLKDIAVLQQTSGEGIFFFFFYLNVSLREVSSLSNTPPTIYVGKSTRY